MGNVEQAQFLNLILEKQVLYHDTDSITYIYKRSNGVPLPNVVEGSMLGNWEAEDTEYGDVVEFVALAPKTYGKLFADGTKKFKCKGISINLANKKYASYNTILGQVKSHLDGNTPKIAYVAQMNFLNMMGGATETSHSFKKLQFVENNLKGELHGTILYPYGFCQECKTKTCNKH